MPSPNINRMKRSKIAYLILALLSPFLVFCIAMAVRYFKGGTGSAEMLKTDFYMLFQESKGIKEYIFPVAAVFTVGLLAVVIHLFNQKPVSSGERIIFPIFGTYALLTGSRILFFIAKGAKISGEVIEFIHGGITLYSFTLSLIIVFLMMWLLSFFCRR